VFHARKAKPAKPSSQTPTPPFRCAFSTITSVLQVFLRIG
jgi:hypothetical protein